MIKSFDEMEVKEGPGVMRGAAYRASNRRPSFLTFVRGGAYLISGLQALASVVFWYAGWWFLAIGLSSLGSDSAEEALAAFWIVIVLAPFPILWLLTKHRNRGAAAVFLLEAAALVPVAWDPHRDEFAWGYFLVAAIIAWISVALIAGEQADQTRVTRSK